MAELSAATGLQKASLYYRFPRGKAQMADETLGFVDKWFVKNVFSALTSSGQPHDRVATMCESIRCFFEGGAKSCPLEALSLGHAEGIIQDHLQATFNAWKIGLSNVIAETGRDGLESNAIAEQIIAIIEGSLIVRRLAPDSEVFERSLQQVLRMMA